MTHAYEKNSLNLVMKIISSSEKLNGYLTFEALKYLSALLCHKKFATEFIASQGLQVCYAHYICILTIILNFYILIKTEI